MQVNQGAAQLHGFDDWFRFGLAFFAGSLDRPSPATASPAEQSADQQRRRPSALPNDAAVLLGGVLFAATPGFDAGNSTDSKGA